MENALKVIAFVALLPLLAVAAFGLTIIEGCTPSNWEKQTWNLLR
jgi:hypothetical protein